MIKELGLYTGIHVAKQTKKSTMKEAVRVCEAYKTFSFYSVKGM